MPLLVFTCHCNEYPLVLTYASHDCQGLTFVAATGCIAASGCQEENPNYFIGL